MSFEKWKEVKVGDVVDTISITHKLNKDNIILINTSDVLDGKVLNHSYVINENLRGQFKKSFQKGDILYSEIRPQNKRFAFVDFEAEDYVASTKLMVLRKKNNNINPNFLFQILKSSDVIRKLQMIAESRSGTFPQITYSELADLDIPLPFPEEQRAIAATLSALDDKIEINNRINKTLEEMAQALFKRWFVDFEFPDENGQPYKSSGGEMEESELGLIPKGWKIATIRELAKNIQYGLTRSACAESIGPKFLRITDIQGGVVKWNEVPYCEVSGKEFMKYKLGKGDIVVARTGASTGENIYISSVENTVFASYLVRFQFDDLNFARYVGAFMRTKSYFDYVKNCIGGSAQPNASAQVLAGVSFLRPSTNIIASFAELLERTDNQKVANDRETIVLSSLRDALLPKLMSGEIRVPIDEVAADV